MKKLLSFSGSILFLGMLMLLASCTTKVPPVQPIPPGPPPVSPVPVEPDDEQPPQKTDDEKTPEPPVKDTGKYYLSFLGIKVLGTKDNNKALSKIREQFDEGIKNALRKTFGPVFDETRAKSPPSGQGHIHKIEFYLSKNKSVELSLKMDIMDDATGETKSFDFPVFSFEEKDSLLNNIKEHIINQDMFDPEGILLEEPIREKIASINLERSDLRVNITVKPRFEEIDDTVTAWNQMVLSEKLKITEYEITEKYNNGEYILDPYFYEVDRKKYRGDYSSLSPEIDQYINALQPSISVASSDQPKQWTKQDTLKATDKSETRYYVRYSYKSDTKNTANYTFDDPPEGTEKEYYVKKLPEYLFGKNKVSVTDDEITVSYNNDNTDFIIYDIDALEINADKGTEKELVQYIYINDEMARFINDNNGNLLFFISNNFDMNISIVKNIKVPRVGRLLKSGGTEDRLIELKNVIKNAVTITEIKKPDFNGLLCDTLKEEVDTEKADWFIKLTFNHAVPSYPDATIPLEYLTAASKNNDVESIVSDNVARGISDYFETSIAYHPATTDQDKLDMARVLYLLGNTKLAEVFLKDIETSKQYTAIIRDLKTSQFNSPDDTLLVIKRKPTGRDDLFHVTVRGKIAGYLKTIIENGITHEEPTIDLSIHEKNALNDRFGL